MPKREFLVMFNGAYTSVPPAKLRSTSNYIDLPNTHYETSEGIRTIKRMIDGAQLVERLGYDGVVFSEQHNGPMGLLGNPMLFGSYLAAATERIRIGVVGPIMNGYLSPLRLAEEISLLDILSNGRLTLGLPLGHGMQYHSMGMVNPVTARERFREGHELLLKALTEPGPFEWMGKHFQIPYVNLWPRPVQSPHPPIVILGGGSNETLELVAKYGHGYLPVGITSPEAIVQATHKLEQYSSEFRTGLERRQVWSSITFHVAETDAQARAEAQPVYEWMMQNFFDSAMHDSFPPGYLSPATMEKMLGGGEYRSKPPSETAFESAMTTGNLVVGSPDTVHDRICELIQLYEPGRVLLGTNSDIKPEWMATKSLTLFAEQVLPRLRGLTEPAVALSDRIGYQNEAEYQAERHEKVPEPSLLLDGERVTLRQRWKDLSGSVNGSGTQ